jgi:putative ABC transport system permease protein
MFAQEIRYVRLLFTRSPVLSIAAVLALAIGIAGNSAMFSIVSAVLIKPLPYPHPDRIVAVMDQIRSNPSWTGAVSLPDYLDWQAQSKTLEAWAIYLPLEGSVILDGQPVTLRDVYISSGLVQTTETQPLMGSLDPPDAPGNPSHIYISERLWRTRLHADLQIIGKTLTVEGVPRTIRAVLPAGFNIGFERGEGVLWIPTPPPPGLTRDDHELRALARLRPGATLAEAQKEMRAIADELTRKYPITNADFSVRLETLQQSLTEDVSTSLWSLLGAVLLVQLIVCTNVASLLLSRAAERAQQTAIRIALGASLSDIARQCLAEGLALALCGGIIGLLAGRGVLALGSLLQTQLPVTHPVVFDWRVAGFAFALSVLTGVLASLAPWWQARFIRGGDLLKEGGRATASLQRRRLLRVFAGVEIALSLVLLVGAGLLVADLSAARTVKLGYDPKDLYSVRLIVPFARQISTAQLSALYDRLLARVNSIPGLRDASLITLLPPDWGNNQWVFANGKRDPRTEREFVEFRAISPGFFRLMKIPLNAGRLFDARDLAGSEKTVVLNDIAAKEYWPHGNAIGSYLKAGELSGPSYRVVGIVRSYRNAGPVAPARPEMFFLYAGRDERHMYLAVRSSLPQARVAELLQKAVLDTDSSVSFSEVQSMSERIGDSVWVLRFQTVLLTVFSLFSVLLAVVGVYSVMSYSVSQRTTEIGIRLAMGADPFKTLNMIVREGWRLAVIAASLGMLVAIAITVSTLHVNGSASSLKPLPLIGSYFLILIFATAACVLPARRAALVDPMVALRPESPQSLRMTLRLLLRAPQRILRSSMRRRTAQRNLDVEWIRSLSESMDQAGSVREVLVEGVARLRGTIHAQCAALFVRADDLSLRCEAADNVPDSAGVRALATDSFVVRRLRGLKHAIGFDERDLAAWEHFAEQSDPETRSRRAAEIATLRAANSALLVPVWLKGELLAVLSFGPREKRTGPDEYDEADISATEGAATQLAFLIENGRLMDRVAAGERTRQELVLAARFQRRLFPEKPLNAAQIELAGECQPARSIGGDYYDFLELPNGQIGIALADVAGKGIAAALLTSIIQASVRSLAPDQGRPLAALVKRINDLLYQSTEAASYATFFYAQFDPVGCRLKFVNAGHNPPYFLHASRNGEAQSIRELPAGGPIIGLLPVVSFEEQQIDLVSGDLLVIYTDGIPEALNEAEEEYGEDRLQKLVLSVADRSADEIRSAILQDVRTFIGAAAQYDDMTALVMKVK